MCLLVDVVPNQVVSATADAVVVPAMHGVVVGCVLVFVAIVG